MPRQGGALSLRAAFKRGIFIMSVLFNASIGVLALWFLPRPGSVHIPVFHPHRVITPPAVEYKDFVSILLTALGVMIALGSGLIAVLAIFGYSEGRKMVEALIRDEVRQVLLPTLARQQMEQRVPETTPADADRIARAFDDVR